MKTNKAGIELIKKFEGFRAKAYKDPVGIPTIFYGHTTAAGPPKVVMGMIGTKEEGERVLVADLTKFEAIVARNVKRPINENQFSALVSFTFNLGEGNLKKSVLKAVNEGRFKDVPSRMALYRMAGGKVLKGLVRRRAAEGELFMRPV